MARGTSRRSADGALVTPGAAAAASIAAGSDAELIEVADDAMAASVALHLHDIGMFELTEEQVDSELDRAFGGGDRLMHMRPVTPEGMIAKAVYVRLHFHRLVVNERGATMESAGDHHEKLVWSLLNDLLNGRPLLAGRA